MLELTVLAGAFIQELISPVPSFVVFVPAGASLQAEGKSIWYIIMLALVIGISRVLAGLVLYYMSGKLRTWIYTRRQAWLGVSRRDIEKFKKKMGRHGGWWSIFGMWAIPIVPGAVISLGAGFMKIPMPTVITATYFGSIINALTYLLIGYFGLKIFGFSG